MNEKYLKPLNTRTPEERKKIASLGGYASTKKRRAKKMLSEIYADFLLKKHEIKDDEGNKVKLSPEKYLAYIISNILEAGGSPASRELDKIMQLTEGSSFGDNSLELVITDEPLEAENADKDE